MEISLNPDIEKLVSRQVQSGRFPTAADVIESAVLLLTERQICAGTSPGKTTGDHPFMGRSPRGILADLRSDITPEEIKEARREMWSGLPAGEA